MPPRLFGRTVILQIGLDGSPGKDLRGFRVKFKVEASKSNNPNTATIEIWNVAPSTRALAASEGALVRLLVGYNNTPLLLFQGRPIEGGVKSERREVDRVLTLECQDGGEEMRSQLSLGFATDTTAAQVLEEVLTHSGLARGSIDLPDQRYVGGLVLSGSTRKILADLGRSLGRDVYIRDGALQVSAPGGTTGERSPVFSVDAGNLIGSPKARDKNQIEVRALLGGAEGLRPGKPFRLQCEEFSGDYVAEEVTFTGDSGWETSFYVEVVGKPL